MNYYVFDIALRAIIKASSIPEAIDMYEILYPESKEFKVCKQVKESEVKALILDVLFDKLEVAIFLDDVEHFINKEVLEHQHKLLSNHPSVLLSDLDFERIEKETK